MSRNHPFVFVVGANPIPGDDVSFNHAKHPVIIVYPGRIMVSCSSDPPEFQTAMARVILEELISPLDFAPCCRVKPPECFKKFGIQS